MARGPKVGLALTLTALASLPGTMSAQARAPHAETKTVGAVTASLSWRGEFAETKDVRLTIERAGVGALDTEVVTEDCDRDATPRYACFWPGGENPLALRDLDADGEPEAVVGAFTGGAHCCLIALVYHWTGADYAVSERNFFDPGYRIRDLDDDGRAELVTADTRFYAFASAYAESVPPIQVFQFAGGRFDNVTGVGAYRDAIAKDLRRVRAEYKRRANSRQRFGVRAALAAYVADLYRLGREQKVEKVLRSALRRGLLEPTRFDTFGPFGKKFVRKLERRLQRWGYAD